MKKKYIDPEMELITIQFDVITESLITSEDPDDYSMNWNDKILY